jgi:hypothetical protein
MLELLEKFYKLEINVHVSSFFDAGWTVRVDGDYISGYKHEFQTYDLVEAVKWLMGMYYEYTKSTEGES